MKKILFALIFSFLIFLPVIADECDQFDETADCISFDETDEDMSGYTVGIGVYYNYCHVKCANPSTFEIINAEGINMGIYGKDKNNVYFGIKRLDGISSNNYTIKKVKNDEGGYYLAYDDDTVYLNYIRFDQIDPDTFEYLDRSSSERIIYFKDKNHVYELKENYGYNQNILYILKDAAPAHSISDGYEITDTAVYWYGKKIEEADPASFELFHFGYAKDKNNVFFEGKIEYGADAKSFTELEIILSIKVVNIIMVNFFKALMILSRNMSIITTLLK